MTRHGREVRRETTEEVAATASSGGLNEAFDWRNWYRLHGY